MWLSSLFSDCFLDVWYSVCGQSFQILYNILQFGCFKGLLWNFLDVHAPRNIEWHLHNVKSHANNQINSNIYETWCKSHSMLSGSCTSKKFHNKPLKQPNHKMSYNIWNDWAQPEYQTYKKQSENKLNCHTHFSW